MTKLEPVLYRLGVLLALVLALLTRSAEGLTFFDQNEAPTVPPTSALYPNSSQVIFDLSGEWQIREGEDDAYRRAWIPSCFSDAQTRVEFRRDFSLPDSLKSWNLQVHLPEISYSVELWLNGRFVSSFTGSHLGFSSDLSRDHLRFGGSNELVLKVDNSLSPDQSLPVFPQLFQPLNYGGIFAGVFLRAVPAWSIEELSLIEQIGKDSASVNGQVNVRIARYSAIAARSDSMAGSQSVRAGVQLLDSSGAVLSEGKSEIIGQTNGDQFQVAVNLSTFRPEFWSPSTPTLYSLSAYLISGVDTIHQYSQTLGFKRVRIVGDQIVLNNSPLRIRAVDYAIESANGGRAVSESRMSRDLDAMKELGINALRVRYQIPPQSLARLADEKGLLLFFEAGLDHVPSELFERPKFKHIVEHSYDLMLSQFGDHVSILAWGMGSQLDNRHPKTQAFLASLREFIRERDGRPCYVEQLPDQPALPGADIEIVFDDADYTAQAAIRPGSATRMPRIYSFGKRAALRDIPVSEQSTGLVNQAEELIRRVNAVDRDPAAAGFSIHSFADYHGASPLLSQPISSDPLLYTYGLVNYHRQERIAYYKLRDLAQTGQVTAPIPTDVPEEPPLAFPAAGLVALLLLSIEIRRNNVFRQNLKRVFLHAHGFYSDLRFRRFLHTNQPLLLWIFESVTLAVLLASLLHALRFNLHFDYVLSHFVPWPTVKAGLVNLIWSPFRSVVYFSIAFLLLIVILTAVVRLFTIPFREKVDFWQSANYVIWALAAILLLLPVSVIFYRMLSSEQFHRWALLLAGVAIVWCIIRLLNAVRTGLGISVIRIYLIVAMTTLFVGGGLAFLLTNSRQTFAYLSYFQSLFGAN